jgi:uncharacterized protein DUF4440
MARIPLLVTAIIIFAIGAHAQTAPDSAELTRLLKSFLDGASRNDSAMHDRFWAEDLIYTGSAGRRIGKADIMRGQRSAAPPRPAGPTTTYTAEDVRIQQYGTTAIVAFRLVGVTANGDRTETANYLNTGTFLKRGGKWQVVAWQSTRMPRSDEDARKDAAAIEVAFHQAILSADVKTLESLMDENFIWTHDSGQQTTRQSLLEQLGSGRLKYSKMENKNITTSVHGDAAIVRGASSRQRSAIPGEVSGDPGPFVAHYTLTLTNRGNGWRAVAMHSSRP